MLDKKASRQMERRLTQALTDACETAKPLLPGFAWLTHLVDYRRFPDSLRVVWVFETQDDLARALKGDGRRRMRELTEAALFEADVEVGNIDAHLDADSEEECRRVHGGDWERRLSVLERH
ncbi:hypothetical protein [Halomonas organivorans]|uniref:Fis family transcriptional regulator n=1 Tax=Halomonas organivorans TaxID=257772 RepID=A0A7W5G6Q4_9GAMM|nr:hypothetical protein [Halomonas organivorans]MBB3142429.1 hypothetical protein [Halomonas organivorans]